MYPPFFILHVLQPSQIWLNCLLLPNPFNYCIAKVGKPHF